MPIVMREKLNLLTETTKRLQYREHKAVGRPRTPLQVHALSPRHFFHEILEFLFSLEQTGQAKSTLISLIDSKQAQHSILRSAS